jgi:hypothetical protein
MNIDDADLLEILDSQLPFNISDEIEDEALIGLLDEQDEPAEPVLKPELDQSTHLRKEISKVT